MGTANTLSRHKGGIISLLVGIDIGGTKTAIAIGDAHGQLLATRRYETRPSGDAKRDLVRLAVEVRQLVDGEGVRMEEIAAVGVAAPGPLDYEAGRLITPPNLPWGEVPVRDILEQEIGRPVNLENDANAAALAEWKFGAAQGYRQVVFLTVSTGIGGGLVLGGRVYRGTGGGAG